MKAFLEHRLADTWYGDQPPGPWLRLLEKGYARGFRLHQAWLKKRVDESLVHKDIVVVGNLAVGGSGKTPFVVRLCEIASELGYRPGMVSRGYGRQGRGPVHVTGESDPHVAGDEPVLLAARTGLPVQVDADREAACHALLEQGVNLLISDDGLQRASLPRKLEICIRDRDRGFGNGHLLPAGPLREPVARASEIEFLVDHVSPGIDTSSMEGNWMQLEAGAPVRLHAGRVKGDSGLDPADGPVHAVAGIAAPGRFFRTLEKMGIRTIQHVFPDHHCYTRKDFETIGLSQRIVMTEKDAVKCRKLPLFNAWYVPVSARFSDILETNLRRRLLEIGGARIRNPAQT